MKRSRMAVTKPAAVADFRENIDELPQMLQITDVMRITGLGYMAIYQRIRSGSIPARKLAGRGPWLIPKDKLLELLSPEPATA